ncbi:MAG: RDD family protein [Actinomycetota bacterium]
MEKAPSGPRAGFWKRFVALLIDLILVGIVTTILFGFRPAEPAWVGALMGLLSTAATIAYFTYLEGSPSGQTIGKRAVGIRVLDFHSGTSIGYARALGRNVFAYFISPILLLGYLWMLWDREKQTWHDKVVSSVVVPSEAYPVDKWPG